MGRRNHDMPSLRYPVIDGFEPVWYVGDTKPDHYIGERGQRRETPNYDTWTGPWSYFRDFGSFM